MWNVSSQAIVEEHKQDAALQEAAQTQPAAPSPAAADSTSQHGDQPRSSPVHTPAAAASPLLIATPAAQAASPPAGAPATSAAAAAASAMTPAANAISSPAATPVPAGLLRHTQAANLLTGSPLAATPASRVHPSSSGRQGDAPPSQGRPAVAAGMHAPSQATQNTEVSFTMPPASADVSKHIPHKTQHVMHHCQTCVSQACIASYEPMSACCLLAGGGTGLAAVARIHCMLQEADREIRELLAWMRQDGGSSDEEGDMLMALAEQAGPTPKSHSQRSSQQVYMTPLSP